MKKSASNSFLKRTKRVTCRFDEMGLEESEAITYLGLLHIGPVTIGNLAIKLGFDRGKIDITISEVANRVQIEVEDNGPEISEDVLPKIFDPLFTTKQTGTGLGLLSCNNIIKSHREKISVNTKIDAGIRFTTDLPMNPYQVFSKYTQK